MTEPKVSERMFNLVECALGAARYWSTLPFDEALLKDGPGEGNHVQQLLSAIAEIEQRAEKAESELTAANKRFECGHRIADWDDSYGECVACKLHQDAIEADEWAAKCDKWKEVAVAESRLRQLKFCSAAVAAEAAKRVGLAIAALGDEWDEAVR